jgi:membrane associated rhomboid family serine protease
MGFQDRDYYRDSSQSPYITSMVVKLMIMNGVVFLAQVLFAQNQLTDLLAVHADTIVRPAYWWQFLTAGFAHDTGAINHILFNMMGLYFFGMPLEDRYGRKEFLRFYLLATVLGFIVWSATHYLMLANELAGPELADRAPRFMCLGASGGVTAATLLFCLLYPRATVLVMFLFPIPAWVLGAVIIVSNLFGTSTGTAYDVHLVGAAFAVTYWYFGLNFGRMRSFQGFGRLWTAPRKWFKPRPPLKVHDPEHYYEDLDAEADRLLEKVARDGLGSLTNKERRLLEDYSRRTRQKLR